MRDILIRGLSQEAVSRIDTAAASLGLSATSICAASSRRRPALPTSGRSRLRTGSGSAEVFADLTDVAVMEAAWR